MKKTFWASVGSVLLCLVNPAFSADMPIAHMPVKGAPPPFLAPFYNWTGFYVGINGGYGFGTSRWNGRGGGTTDDFDIDSFLIGGTIGYNYQMGSIVWGLEGDFDWSDINIKGSTRRGACPGTCTTTNQWLGTARFRLGYAFDGWLPFVTAGGAFGDIKATSSLGSTNSTEFGWTLGGGVEWAFLYNWTGKVEYLYVDLADGQCSGRCAGGPPFNVRFNTHLVRAGVNYRF
jgi:outer membrane immunogenic protein